MLPPPGSSHPRSKSILPIKLVIIPLINHVYSWFGIAGQVYVKPSLTYIGHRKQVVKINRLCQSWNQGKLYIQRYILCLDFKMEKCKHLFPHRNLFSLKIFRDRTRLSRGLSPPPILSGGSICRPGGHIYKPHQSTKLFHTGGFPSQISVCQHVFPMNSHNMHSPKSRHFCAAFASRPSFCFGFYCIQSAVLLLLSKTPI